MMKRILEGVAVALATVFFIGLLALIMVEWFVGCGESWVQADGSRVIGECVFLNHGKEK
jgi:hypothetical protein